MIGTLKGTYRDTFGVPTTICFTEILFLYRIYRLYSLYRKIKAFFLPLIEILLPLMT